MRLFRQTATAVVLAVAVPGTLWAQAPTDPDNPVVQIEEDNTVYGGTSAEFLLFGSGARGMALGGSLATIVDDVNSMYYNPAGLVGMSGPEATLTIMPYFADTDYYWTGLAFPFSDGDFGVGFYLARFGFGDQPIYTASDPDGLSNETYGVNEVVAGLSFAHAFIDRFSAGFTLKFISDDLATGALGGAKASTAAVDFGVNFHSELGDRPIALSFVVQNLGGHLTHSGESLRFRDFNKSQGDPASPDQRQDPPVANLVTDAFPLPRLFRAGLGYDVVSMETTRLSLMAEFIESNHTKAAFGFASEFDYRAPNTPIGAALRASYTTQPDNEDIGAIDASSGADGLGLGGGLFYAFADKYKLQFDYAYRDRGVLGSSDVFSVSFGVLN
jgi:hypothetical protein